MEPIKHLESFDEKFVDKQLDINGNIAYEEMKSSVVIDPFDVKRHIIQTVIAVLEEEITKIEYNLKTVYDLGALDAIDSLTTTLLTWKELSEE